jgi:hypothetical protein
MYDIEKLLVKYGLQGQLIEPLLLSKNICIIYAKN